MKRGKKIEPTDSLGLVINVHFLFNQFAIFKEKLMNVFICKSGKKTADENGCFSGKS